MVIERTLIGQGALLLWRNLGSALRASLAPTLAAYLFLVAIDAAGLTYRIDPVTGTASGGTASLIVAALTPRLVWLMTHCWTAVAWHRALLLGDRPGWLPWVPADAVGSYLAWMLALVVPVTLLALGLGTGLVVLVLDPEHPVEALVTVAGLLAQPGDAPAFALLLAAVLLAAALLGGWVTLRASPVLPAAAIGRPLGLGQAWRATAAVRGPILLAALALLSVQVLIHPMVAGRALTRLVTEGVLEPLLAAGVPVAVVGFVDVTVTLALDWPPALFALAVLAALHGRVVEPGPEPSVIARPAR